eukprot:10713934-Alexandrium_andersonii.AAC.1
MVRRLQRAIPRSYQRWSQARRSCPRFEEFTGQKVTTGIHPLSLASILEHGAVLCSAGVGHEFTGPGVHTCPQGSTAPFWYATPCFIK